MATFILNATSLDDESEEKSFGSLDEAIAYAKDWFAKGYDNQTIHDETRREVREKDLPELEACLRRGEEFYCSRFYETITVRQEL